ncbi:hypothetical protein FRC08_017776 [Ceratobasidium sp. 394]|nr:hypothetical protein FRC08_017776 [Ceratobasidium sp. 394]
MTALPAGISITQIYTDYLRHIFRHTQYYFSERMFDGQRLWQSLASSMDIVMTYPSGWGTSEQRVLRSATMAAVPDSVQQILLISETEASIQMYLNFPEMSEPLTPGANLVVCNAGRFIVETIIYKVTRVNSRPHLEQVGASACIRAGSIFMDEAAESYLRQKLQSADLDVDDVDDYTQAGLEYFSKYIRRRFDATEKTFVIPIGSFRLTIRSINVRRGRMVLKGSTVRMFFDGCVGRIIGSVALKSAGLDAPYFWLVGDCAEIPYLQAAMRSHFGASNRLFVRDTPEARSVADGAVIWDVNRSAVNRSAERYFAIPHE